MIPRKPVAVLLIVAATMAGIYATASTIASSMAATFTPPPGDQATLLPATSLFNFPPREP